MSDQSKQTATTLAVVSPSEDVDLSQYSSLRELTVSLLDFPIYTVLLFKFNFTFSLKIYLQEFVSWVFEVLLRI